MHTNSLAPSSSTEAAVSELPGSYRGRIKSNNFRERARIVVNSLKGQRVGRFHCFFAELFSYLAVPAQVGVKSAPSINLTITISQF